jgi:hypothetical protein
MKKITPISIIGILVLSTLGAAAYPIEDFKQEKTRLFFSKPLIKEDNDAFVLELEEANSVFMKRNHYMLPTYEETFILPFGSKVIGVRCNPKNIHKETLTGKLKVAPNPIIIGQKTSVENPKEAEPVAVDTWYEYHVGTGIYDDERVVFVKVQVFPVRYRPNENTVEWAEEVEVEIDYKEPRHPMVSEEEYAFVVLTPSAFKSALGSLISHKNNRGISSKLVTLDEVYNGVYFPVEGRDDPEKIKYFIKNAIENWGTSYVLLVGGRLKFPTRTTHINVVSLKDSELFVTDLYFADIYDDEGKFSSWDSNDNDIFGEYTWGTDRLTDEVDLYPDVYLGRLACISGSEVTTCINKIIKYETTKAYTKNWFTNLVVVGGDSFTSDPYYGDDSGIAEGELVNEVVVDVMDGFIPDRLWATNSKLGGVNGVGNIDGAINKGAGFVHFSGHGNLNVWATHHLNGSRNVWLPTPSGGYFSSHVNGLSNREKLPIVVTDACLTSKFNERSDCFGWVFMSNPNGGGIASFGSAAKGYSYMGRYVTYGLVAKMAINTFKAYRRQGAVTVGEMWSKAIERYISAGMDAADYKTVEEWMLFGDPTLTIGEESSPPKRPSRPEGPTSGKINTEYAYSASTTDPEGDKIYYLFDWGDGEYSGWIGPYYSGQTAQASHIWTAKGDYRIRVKAKDEHGVQSSWSDPLSISMPKNKEINPFFPPILQKLLSRFPALERIFHQLQL